MPTYLDRVAAAGARVNFEASPSPAAPPALPGPKTMGQAADLSSSTHGEEGSGKDSVLQGTDTPGMPRAKTAAFTPGSPSRITEQSTMAAKPVKEPALQQRERQSTSAPFLPGIAHESAAIPVPQRIQRQVSPTAASRANALPPGPGFATQTDAAKNVSLSSTDKGGTQRDVPRNVRFAEADTVSALHATEDASSSPGQRSDLAPALQMQNRENDVSTEFSGESPQLTPEGPRASNPPSAALPNRNSPPVAVAANQFSPILPRVGRASEPEPRITIGRVDVLVTNQLPPPPTAPAARPQGGNWQESLRARFLDRFTLRP